LAAPLTALGEDYGTIRAVPLMAVIGRFVHWARAKQEWMPRMLFRWLILAANSWLEMQRKTNCRFSDSVRTHWRRIGLCENEVQAYSIIFFMFLFRTRWPALDRNIARIVLLQHQRRCTSSSNTRRTAA